MSLEYFFLPPQAVSTPSSPPRSEVAGAQDEYAEDSSDEEVGRRYGQGRGEPALGRPSGRLAPAPLQVWKSDLGSGTHDYGSMCHRGGRGCSGPCPGPVGGWHAGVTLLVAFPTPPRPVTLGHPFPARREVGSSL